MTRTLRAALTVLAAATAGASSAPSPSIVRIQSDSLRLEFDGRLYSRVVATFDGREAPLGGFRASEHATAGGKEVTDFAHVRHEEQEVEDGLGRGRRLV